MFGLFRKYDVHMCSEVRGMVTLNGKPVSGALVKRHLKFAYKIEKEDEAETDFDGVFFLPEVSIESKIPGDMFSQESTSQLITVEYGGEKYDLWSSKLPSINEPDEYREKLSSLNGALENKRVNFAFPNHSDENLEYCASSICRWEKDFEIYKVDDGIDYFKDL